MEQFLISHLFMIEAVLAGLAGVLLFAKFLHKKEPMILVASLARMYLAGTGFLHSDLIPIYPFIGLAIIVMLVSDVFSSLVYFTSRRYVDEIQKAGFLTTINHLLGKISSIIDNPYIGFFTLDHEGRIEFANTKLHKMLESDNLVGQNLYRFLDGQTVDSIKSSENIHCSGYLMVPSPKGTVARRVKITATATINGHRTITGSIIDYETIVN